MTLLFFVSGCNSTPLVETGPVQQGYSAISHHSHAARELLLSCDTDHRAASCPLADHLGDPGAVRAVDETGFLKKGVASCGVGRQYTGSVGKITSCEIGVFATYVSGKGNAFLHRTLYLPKNWTDKSERLAAAHVPHDIRFASKPSLATAMIGRALTAEVPFSWVPADSVYGVADLKMALRPAGKGSVLDVNANHWFHSWRRGVMWAGEAREIIKTPPDKAWVRASAGHGTKGKRLYDWLYCPKADLHTPDYADTICGTWTRGLLVRRNPADGNLRYFKT